MGIEKSNILQQETQIPASGNTSPQLQLQAPKPIPPSPQNLTKQQPQIADPQNPPPKIKLQPVVPKQNSSHPQFQQQVSFSIDNFFSFSSFLNVMKQVIRSKKTFLRQFLSVDQLIKMLEISQVYYIGSGPLVQIVDMVLDFLIYCHNKGGCQPALEVRSPTPFNDDYPKVLAQKWKRFKDETYNLNKKHLKVLSFIVKNPESNKYEYDGTFFDLKFDFSEGESKQVAAITRKMVEQDQLAFCYLSNYLLKCCMEEEKQGVPFKQISEKQKKFTKTLSNIYKPAPQIIAKYEELKHHKNRLDEKIIPKYIINLTKQSSPSEALDEFIMERAEKANKQKDEYQKMLRSICEKNGGFHFKANVKISSLQQEASLERIKEKMLADIFNEIQLEEQMNVSHLQGNNIQNKMEKERKVYKQKMEKMFKDWARPIAFKVDDMLRAKCLFFDVKSINKCCEDIEKEEQNGRLKILKKENRLDKNTSDLSLKLIFNDVIGELQLAINLNPLGYEFNHKLYELSRSRFYSDITTLVLFNEKITKKYLNLVHRLIKANTESKHPENYDEVATYEEVKKNFDLFLGTLPVSIELSENDSLQKDVYLIDKKKEQLKKIYKCIVKPDTKVFQLYETQIREGSYFAQLQQFEKALSILQSALQNLTDQLQLKPGQQYMDELKIQVIKAEIIFSIGDVYSNMNSHQQAFQSYVRCLKILESVEQEDSKIQKRTVLKSMGVSCKKMKKYADAYSYLQKSLELIEKQKGIQSSEYAHTLGQMGEVYYLDKQKQKGKMLFQQAISILQKVQGTDCSAITIYLDRIGSIVRGKEGIRCLQRSINIQQKEGKFRLELASTWSILGSMFYDTEKKEAIRCFENSNEISQKNNIVNVNYRQSLGHLFYDQQNYSKAIESYQKVLSKYKFQDVRKAKVLNNLGFSYRQQNQKDKGIRCFTQSLAILEEKEGKQGYLRVHTLLQIGKFYKHFGFNSQALNYLTESREIMQKTSHDQLRYCLYQIGMIYAKSSDYNKAIQNFQQSLKLAKEGSYWYSKMIFQIGGCYYKQKLYNQALGYYLQCIQLNEGKENNLNQSYQYVSNIYHYLGDEESSKKYLDQAVSFARKEVNNRNYKLPAKQLEQINIFNQILLNPNPNSKIMKEFKQYTKDNPFIERMFNFTNKEQTPQ